NPIPASESRWGSFTILRYQVDRQLHDILKDLESKRSLPKDSAERLIRDLFRSGTDLERRNELGTKPLAPWLQKIGRITDREGVIRLLPELHRQGVNA